MDVLNNLTKRELIDALKDYDDDQPIGINAMVSAEGKCHIVSHRVAECGWCYGR